MKRRSLCLPLRIAASALLAAFAGCPAPTGGPLVGNDAAAPADLASPHYDLAIPDLAQASDAAARDLAVQGGTPPDLAAALDLSEPPDLAAPDATSTDGAAADAAPTDGAACNQACNNPPPPMCMKNVIVTTQNGLCVNGACVYPTVKQVCPNGCYQAQCTAPLSYLGATAAFTSMGGVKVTDTPNVVGNASANDSVSVITQTFPFGSVDAAHLIWATDANYKSQQDLVMQFDHKVGNNDQWYAIIPRQAAGTQVWFYVRADGYGVQKYDPGNFNNYTYKSQ